MYRIYYLVNCQTDKQKKIIIGDSVLNALGLLFFINTFFKGGIYMKVFSTMQKIFVRKTFSHDTVQY